MKRLTEKEQRKAARIGQQVLDDLRVGKGVFNRHVKFLAVVATKVPATVEHARTTD